MAFKMKGSPMKRNFGIGKSPMSALKQWDDQREISARKLALTKDPSMDWKNVETGDAAFTSGPNQEKWDVVKESLRGENDERKANILSENYGGTWELKKDGWENEKGESVKTARLSPENIIQSESTFKMKGSAPLKQTPGGDASEAVSHWKDYTKAAKPSASGRSSVPRRTRRTSPWEGKWQRGAARRATQKQAAKKVIGRVAGRLIPGVGWGLAAYDAIRTIPKVVESQKKALKEEAKRHASGSAKTNWPTGPKY